MERGGAEPGQTARMMDVVQTVFHQQIVGQWRRGVQFLERRLVRLQQQLRPTDPPTSPPVRPSDPTSEGRKSCTERRKSVCAERYNPEEDAKQEVFPVWHKTAAQKQRLAQAVGNVFLLKTLDSDQLNRILDAMQEKKVKAQSCVIRQGDDGDNFYIIDSGWFDVYIDDAEGKRKFLTHYDNQGSFGELALMYNTRRTASVVAKTDGVLWALDRLTFRRIVLSHACNKRIKYERLVERVPQLRTLTEYERSSIADALISRTYTNDQLIIHQGDEPDGMYFIEEGTVRVVVNDQNGTDHEINRMTTNEYFGELALVTNQRRWASVYAVGDLKLAFLDVAAFERLLGPCVELMKRNIALYEEQLSTILGSQAKIRK